MSRPILLDLFCKGGGAGSGYSEEFDIVGVDVEPQPNYPFEFHQSCAIEFLLKNHRWFDAYHASPECKGFSSAMEIRTDTHSQRAKHPDFITPLRPLLQATGRPYIIENVESAKPVMKSPIMLCGVMFGLPVLRHRLFESNILLMQPPHPKHEGTVSGGQYMGPYGQGGAVRIDRADKSKGRRKGSRRTADWARGMEIDWMTRDELTQAIPPAYTRFLGRQLREAL